MLADAKAQGRAARLREPVARHREHGRGDERHAVQELDAGARPGAAQRDADHVQRRRWRRDNTDFPSLLTSTSSYVNSDLAAYYNTGVPGTSNSTSFTKTPVGTSAAPRMGLLTHASVLAMHAHTSLPSPTLRGRMVRQQILCEQIAPPPAQVGGTVIPPPPTSLPAGQTTRDAVHAALRRQPAVQRLPPVHGLRRVRLRQLRRHRRVHHRGRRHARRPERDVPDHRHDERAHRVVHQRDRHDHEARGQHAGARVLRAAGAALRDPARRAGGRRLLGAAGLPGLPERRVQRPEAAAGDRPDRFVPEPLASERGGSMSRR